MKNGVLYFTVFLTISVYKSQTVTSSCVAPDSVVKQYKKDADRMAVRRVYHINSRKRTVLL